MLSAKPFASLARVVAVAGAMMNASPHQPNSTWLFQLFSETISVMTGCLLRVERVKGEMNLVAASVIRTLTSAPDLTNKRVRNAAL